MLSQSPSQQGGFPVTQSPTQGNFLMSQSPSQQQQQQQQQQQGGLLLNSIVNIGGGSGGDASGCSRSPSFGASPPASTTSSSSLSASFGAGLLDSTSLDEVLQGGMYANMNTIQSNPLNNVSLSNSNQSNSSTHSNGSNRGVVGLQLPSNGMGNVLMAGGGGGVCNLQTKAERSEDDEDDFDWSSIL